VHSQHRNAGLSHLFEAATALTKLVDVPRATKPDSPDLQQCVVSDDDTHANGVKRASSKTTIVAVSREIFPQRLMSILSDASVSDVISWLPHGRSFVIIRPDCLAERVLSKYFASDPRSSTKYPSFTRKLNRWGFRQATRGPDTGAFQHLLFRRDQPELCLDMVCQKSRKPKASKPTTEDKKVEAPSSSLPPKKRKMQGTHSQVPATSEPAQMHLRVVSDLSLSTHTVSGDDQSVSSASSSSAPSQAPAPPAVPMLMSLTSYPAPPVAPALPAAPAPAPIAPIVVQDPYVVAAALKVREEMERLAVAKAMLFDAYIKALNGQ